MIALLVAACARPTVEGPDVILVSVDTLRADRFGFTGHAGAHTPAFDALAAGGRVFAQATTPFPRTTPALGALHTGLWPVHHGAGEVGEVVAADQRLAGLLADHGWQTAAVSAMRVAGPDQRMDLGFERFELRHDLAAPALAAVALEVAAALDPRRPAFLWVHFADPHFPYLPDPSSPLSPDAPRCRALGARAAAGKLQRAPLFANRGGEALAVRDECLALYDAEVAAVDAAVGDLLASLRRHRGDRPRYVVLTADHGENQGEGGLFYEHGPNVHDASLRVPLVVDGPGVVPGTDAGVARLEDLLPTLLEVLGLPVPPGLDGASLADRLRGGPPDARVALAESGSALHLPLFGVLVSGREGRWCLNDGRFSWCTLGPRSGLFDHDADPRLASDLAATEPEVAERLRSAATRWRPEQTHERVARSADRKLVAVPTVDGWVRTLTAVAAGGTETAVEDPAALAVLGPALDAFAETLDARRAPGAAADGTDEALRQLGYVE